MHQLRPTFSYRNLHEICSWINLNPKPIPEPENNWRPFIHLSFQQFWWLLPIKQNSVSLQEAENGLHQLELVSLARVVYGSVA